MTVDAGLFDDQEAAAPVPVGAAMRIAGTLTQAAQVRAMPGADGHNHWCVRLQVRVDGPGAHSVTADIPCTNADQAKARADALPKGARVALCHPPSGLHLHMPRAALADATHAAHASPARA